MGLERVSLLVAHLFTQTSVGLRWPRRLILKPFLELLGLKFSSLRSGQDGLALDHSWQLPTR
jgi:hypothetical protein